VEKEYQDQLSKLDKEILFLNQIYSSLQNSYKNIQESDADGLPIDPKEYDVLNLNNKENQQEMSAIIKNEQIENFYDDIDGEPI
jgi:hypothetical protein